MTPPTNDLVDPGRKRKNKKRHEELKIGWCYEDRAVLISYPIVHNPNKRGVHAFPRSS
jgi:hypothetical protein